LYAFAAALANCTNLYYLNLSNAGLGDGGMIPFTEGLAGAITRTIPSCRRLTVLNFGWNKFDVEGARGLARLFDLQTGQENSIFPRLSGSILWSTMGDAGARLIAKAFKRRNGGGGGGQGRGGNLPFMWVSINIGIKPGRPKLRSMEAADLWELVETEIPSPADPASSAHAAATILPASLPLLAPPLAESPPIVATTGAAATAAPVAATGAAAFVASVAAAFVPSVAALSSQETPSTECAHLPPEHSGDQHRQWRILVSACHGHQHHK